MHALRRHAPWTTRLAALAALLLGSGCTADPLALDAEELTFEVLDLGRDAMPVYFNDERLAALPGQLQGSPVDLLCLQGVSDPAERRAIAEAVAPTFPFSLALPTSDDTPVDDPADAQGAVPPPESEPPCAAVAGDLDTLITCMGQPACAVRAGDDGQLINPECVGSEKPCSEGLWAGDPRRRCLSCVAAHARTGAVFQEIRQRCLGLDDPLPLHGQHGMMILSKLPLTHPSIRVLPAVGLRRAVIGATAHTPRGSTIEVFCAGLGPTAALGVPPGKAPDGTPGDPPPTTLPADPDPREPYPGRYGDADTGWLEENALQVEQLIAQVSAQRGPRPAVVLGNFGTSPAIERDGSVVLPAMGPSSSERLAQAFAPATAASFTPSCTICPENRLRRDVAPSWLDRIYLAGLPTSAVRESARSYLGNVVATPWMSATDAVPLSMQYGFRARVALP
jgi:hypothetical protein